MCCIQVGGCGGGWRWMCCIQVRRLETWGLQCSKGAFVESNPDSDSAEPTASYCGILIFNLFSEMISRRCFQMVDWWNHRRMYASYTFSRLMCPCRKNRCTLLQISTHMFDFGTTNVREPKEVTSHHPGNWNGWGGVRVLKGGASTCIISSSVCFEPTEATFSNKQMELVFRFSNCLWCWPAAECRPALPDVAVSIFWSLSSALLCAGNDSRVGNVSSRAS